MDRDPAVKVFTSHDLATALGVGRGDLVSLVGGGGKTTALYRLTAEMTRTGLRAAAATTTKIAPPTGEDPAILLCVSEWDELRGRLADWNWGGMPPVIGLRVGHATKVEGILPAWCDRLRAEDIVDALVVEADGSARKAVKAPESWEPVVPDSTTVFVSVLGLSCLGTPLGPDTAFRPKRISSVTGIPLGTPLTNRGLVSLLTSPEGLLRGRTPGMRAVALLNQADLPGAREEGGRLAAEILSKSDLYERVLVASLGRPRLEIEIYQPSH